MTSSEPKVKTMLNLLVLSSHTLAMRHSTYFDVSKWAVMSRAYLSRVRLTFARAVERSVEPETRLRYIFPCMDTMPAFWLVPDNPYLTTPLYEATLKPPCSSPGTATLDEIGKSKCLDTYLKPTYAAAVVEPILGCVWSRKWTNMITDYSLFRRLITCYLTPHHTLLLVSQKAFS